MDADLQAALEGVQRAIEQVEGCNEAERSALIAELKELQELAEKLRQARVEIAVFGEISTGKSALINALAGSEVAEVNARGGWTQDVWRVDWQGRSEQTADSEHAGLILVDTPGLNEVEGEERANMARHAVERADVVLFVTDSDLNETEYNALAEVAGFHKPVILVLNKIDLYSDDDLAKLMSSLQSERVTKLIGGQQNVVQTSAEPREIEYLIESPNGSTQSEWRRPQPNIEALRARILEVLTDEGKALVALNASMYAADRSDRVAALRVQMRNSRAEKVVWSFAVVKALAVAMNPWAVADVAGGMAVDATMVATLGNVYGIPITTANARDLVASILKAAGWLMLSEAAVSFGSSFFKGVTFGGSTFFTALPQGAAAGYGSFLVGQAARYYFEHGASWGDRGPKRVVEQILENTDKKSVIDRLKRDIRGKLARNRHADKE